MKGRTQQSATQTSKTFSPIGVSNLDPNFDYSFKRKVDVEKDTDMQGFEVVDPKSSNSETWEGPVSVNGKMKTSIQYIDTILCKRPKDVSKFYKEMEDQRYNAQQRLVLESSREAQFKLREADANSKFEDSSTGLDKAFIQRPGPTEEV